ncbi:cysteine-rich receptor-like protein kinase, partial [Trifolium medium]|nr:cysteine-rich receptor-like protein kinase [Trifolium medium]
RHTVSSLKKVARMPSQDRAEALKAVKKFEQWSREGVGVVKNGGERFQDSSIVSSPTTSNDWKHWVVMQGNDNVAADDVRTVGEAIGVQIKGDTKNMFSVLARKGRSKQSSSGQTQGETKLQSCDDSICSPLWGNSSHGFSYRPSVGASGGLLTLWDTTEVQVWSSESYENVLWCHGLFVRTGEEFYLANVYAPCDSRAKQVLWDSLSVKIQALGRSRVCVCGDFNAVRSVDERRSANDGYRPLDHIPFNRFIDNNTLIDLPLCGRKYTWFKGDGRSMSRLDRFLLSGEWCLTWPNCTQAVRMRGLSDHCPLVLAADEEDWGPRPLRMLKCWKDVPGYQLFVREKWNSFQIDGWGGFVLKEKLKWIKTALKDWHSSHIQNLPSRIESLKDRMAVLDEKGGEEDLSESELAELHGVSLDIHSLSRLNTSICWQQSRSRWLKEGDANTKYFHSVLASRRRGNAISSLQVDGTIVEGVSPIRQAVFAHFASHFKAVNVDRPRVDNLTFKRLQVSEVIGLIKPFSIDEVKAAVWDCDSFKSPGPDGINFGFIKDFWAEMQGDIMRFVSEFHRNGRLTKGLNATFIALIPKVLANRLRVVMGSVISESQTAFVKGRQILDGILVANEVVDEARKSKKELLLFKVDFEKAYDSVEWGYLEDVMERMGFPTLWRKWIKECVCTATASVLVNGSPTDEFPFERGLRQGDPLSPFLFLLAAEGL